MCTTQFTVDSLVLERGAEEGNAYLWELRNSQASTTAPCVVDEQLLVKRLLTCSPTSPVTRKQGTFASDDVTLTNMSMLRTKTASTRRLWPCHGCVCLGGIHRTAKYVTCHIDRCSHFRKQAEATTLASCCETDIKMDQ